jgi:4-hydroxy-2-oxoheptanedioate aldolase
MGHVGQQTHPEVQEVMEQGVAIIRKAGRIAGVSCPDNLVPKFLDLGVQYFHGTVQTLLQTSSNAYLESMRRSAGEAGL